MIRTENYIRFSHVDEVTETATGMTARLHGEELRVEVIRADLVRLSMSRAGRFDEPPTYAVCADLESALREAQGAFSVDVQADQAVLRTESLVLTLGLDPFRIDAHRSDGSPVFETATDADGDAWAYATLNDAWTFRRTCRPEDAFYGLGEKTGRLNRKGRSFVGWNTDVLNPTESKPFSDPWPAGDPRHDRTSTAFDPYYCTIPLLYHLRHPVGDVAASFHDNGYRTDVDLTPDHEYRVHVSGGTWTEYVFAGPGIPAILQTYTWLTGRTAPPPLWSLGYHQCRWDRSDADRVEAVALAHRDRDIPCDALWLDIEHMDGYRVFTWDDALFPDPQAMMARLRELGFRMVTIVDPGVKYDPGYAVFDSAVEHDVLCRTPAGDLYIGQVWPGNTTFPDFATPEGRRWWGALNAEHVRSGLAGIWNDMNEPATGDIPAATMLFDHGTVPHERLHNQYALLMAMGTVEGLREALPDRRTFVLSRSGFAGIQRYAANWMGDNQARWDHLGLSIAMGCGFGLSGQPFVGADVGGFQGNTQPELFVRWMQYGALTPFFRNHTEIGTIDQYAWTFGETVEALVADAIRSRYRLMPYLYAAFLSAGETGAPIQRPLVFDHAEDGTVRDIDDQYLLGPDLLVAPVTAPATTARQVYLPEGDWYDWRSDVASPGRCFVVAATPMDTIPLYARAGAVVPMWPQAPASTDGYFPTEIELHLFVPRRDASSTSFLQEDDGLTFAAQAGARVRTTFVVTRAGNRVELRAEVEGDGFPEHRREQFVLVVHGAEPSSMTVDGETLRVLDGRVTFPNAGSSFSLDLTVTAT